jgi:hypothetical protein
VGRKGKNRNAPPSVRILQFTRTLFDRKRMISADAKGGTGRKENEREIASSELSIKLLSIFRLRFVVDKASVDTTSSELRR